MRCVSEQELTIWQYVIAKKIDVSFSWISPVIGNEFCHSVVKVACGSTRLLPHGSTATLTMLLWNPWSIAGLQMHEKLILISLLFLCTHCLIFIVNFQTDAWIYNLCNVLMCDRGQFAIVKTKLMSVFHASVLLLTMNFVIISTKKAVNPQLR